MTPSDAPRITVITATIPGREDMLAECRASVAAQTLPAAKHLVYKDTQGRGIQHSMNVLWPQVRTEWLQWIADDDILYPGHLEAVAAYTASADIIHSNCVVVGRDGFHPDTKDYEDGLWHTATALMRTSLVREIGGWDERAFPEDHFFWLKAKRAGARFAKHREPTWEYRFHGRNLTFAPKQVGRFA
jgi:hypothetical protein